MLVGCESGTISGSQQSCQSAGGLFTADRVSCSGSAETASGSVSLDLVGTDDARSGRYRLEALIASEQGSARATVAAAGSGEAGGELSPDRPLRIDAVVDVDEDEDLVASLRVAGEEVRGLSYEATLIPQE